MKRVLMICYYFPPLGGIGSLRALKFAAHLPRFGWKPTVLAPRQGAYYLDPSLLYPEGEVVRTRSLEMSRIGKRIVGSRAGDAEPAQVGPLLAPLRAWVRRRLYYPDPQIGWYPFAARAGRQIVATRRFDALFSTSFPITAHLVARSLHRSTGIPWIAEFRDPWSDALEAGDPTRSSAIRLEQALLREATAVVAPSQGWAAMFQARGARSAQVVTNGYEPADFPRRAARSRDFILSHLGTSYPHAQDWGCVGRALLELRRRNPSLRVRLRFIGDLHPDLRGELDRLGLADITESTGFVPHRTALALLKESSALLLVGGRSDLRHLGAWIPAKTFEYLGSGRPILFVGDAGSETGRLIREFPGCRIVSREDDPEALRFLVSSPTFPSLRRPLGRWTRRRLAAQLARLLDASAKSGR